MSSEIQEFRQRDPKVALAKTVVNHREVACCFQRDQVVTIQVLLAKLQGFLSNEHCRVHVAGVAIGG